MKGCLKSQHRPQCRRTLSVCFGEHVAEQVYTADEWDRTPTEPARKLSYQDVLEMKEITRSLPIADQPSDPISGKPPSRYLRTVPIGLLPLLAEDNCPSTPMNTPMSSVSSSRSPSPPRTSSPRKTFTPPPSQEFIPTWKRTPLPHKPNLTRWTPPPPPTYLVPTSTPTYLPHLPRGQAPPARVKPKFAFVPLLDTPPHDAEETEAETETETETDASQPPTPSLTNASVNSSPMSRASSASPEPPFFQLPPPGRWKYTERYSDEEGVGEKMRGMRLDAVPSPLLPPPSPLVLTGAQGKRRVIVVNDVEIELDEEEEKTPITGSPVLSSSLSRKPQQVSPPPSPSSSMALHAPIRFKRPLRNPTTSAPRMSTAMSIPSAPLAGASVGAGAGAGCSPHRGCERGSPVLVPSA